MNGRRSPQAGALFLGFALIILGGAAFLVQAGGVRVGWPVWIIAPGIALLLGALAVGGQGGSGMAAVGGLVTMVGIVLAVQEQYDLYATWSYAWALVAPGGVGLGLTLYGLATRRGDDFRGGLGALGVGIVLFLLGFLFFEGVLDLSDGRFHDLTGVAAPLVLVGIGVVVLLGAFVPGPWHRPAGSNWGPSSSWTSGGPGAGAAGAMGAGPAGAAAASGGVAGGQPPTPSDWSSPAVERLDVPLEGSNDAEVLVTFGAGRLAIVTAAPGMLLDGTFDGGVKADRGGPGRIRISPPAPMNLGWNRPPFTWRVGITGEVPLRLRVDSGASDGELDLSGLRLAELRLRTGASDTRVTLPASAGYTRVDVEGGAAAIRFRVPDGVAAAIRSSIALGSTDIDGTRFPRTADGRGWASPDFATAANRVEIEIRGGVGSVSVR